MRSNGWAHLTTTNYLIIYKDNGQAGGRVSLLEYRTGKELHIASDNCIVICEVNGKPFRTPIDSHP